MLTKERRKQKDFFEKERLKSKMKQLGVSPLKSSTVSLDLLNMYVVNQISTKKDDPDKVRKPVHVDINQGIKIPRRQYNVELPKSPEHRPSKPFLDDIQKRVQQEVLENRAKYLLEKQNFQSQCLPPSQPTSNKYEDPWFPKAMYRQGNFSDTDVDAPGGLYFKHVNSSEYSNSFGKSPKVIAATDFGNHSRGGPLFDTVNDREPQQATQDEITQPFSALSEEENEKFPTLPSLECYCSFGNKNIISQLFTDSGDANQIFNMHSPYDVKEIHHMASVAQSSPTERDLQGIFTAPEQIFSTTTQNLNTSNQAPIKNQLRDYCIQDINPVIFSEQLENTADFENTERFINQQRNIKVAETMQNYAKNKKGRLVESNLNQPQIFALNKIENEDCNYYDQISNPGRPEDDESQLSSQSPSYSPKQTHRYARTTSEESEEEVQDGNTPCYFENSFPRNYGNQLAVSGSQRSCNCQSVDVSSIFLDSMARGRDNIHPSTKPPMDIRKYDTAPPLHSIGVLKNRHAKAWHNAWSQTEKCAERIEKSDAAIQCNIMQVCSCRSELSSVHSAEIVTSASMLETTGGQNIPVDKAALHSSSSSNAMFVKCLPPETEYLTVHNKPRHISPNYINAIHRGEKDG